MRTITTALTLAVLLALVPAAEARSYKGKTSGGTSVTFKLTQSKISKLKTVVPAVCVETTGSGYTRAGSELFRPPGRFTVGRTRKVKALQPAAMNAGAKATKTYTVTTSRAGRGEVKGKLRVSFSFLRLDLFRTLPYTYLCSGSARFSARAR